MHAITFSIPQPWTVPRPARLPSGRTCLAVERRVRRRRPLVPLRVWAFAIVGLVVAVTAPVPILKAVAHRAPQTASQSEFPYQLSGMAYMSAELECRSWHRNRNGAALYLAMPFQQFR